MSNIIKLDLYTKNDINAPDMLCEIANNKPKNAFVITWDEGGEINYSSNIADTSEVVFQLKRFIHKLYNGDFQ